MPPLGRRLLLTSLPGSLFGALLAWSALTIVGIASHVRTPGWVRALDRAALPLVRWETALLLTCALGGWLLFACSVQVEPPGAEEEAAR